jgi:Na+-transporting NADH:ubiquinone oxidoreductase subunit NqrF|tara:strand:+ start:379 stop:570 length:192 start_codon:yes stop_codon:yes gene_type:complete
MPANAKLLQSQPSRQIWLGGRNARGMYAEDIGKIQKNLRSFRYHLKSRQEVQLRIIFNLNVEE